jgi:Protein of unknown function (DUF2652)/Polyketide cyclase / dehydrase and lipid transport
MGSTPRHGFLLIADLTGYTAYLSRGELEHAPVIAGDLIETVIGRLEPPFRLAKLEGDAAFLFVEDGRADGSLLVDAIEAAYVGFRRRLHSIERATACSCQACGLAPRLDLKLFLHHGAFVHAPIAGRDELAGSSVILVHRLLKGTAADAAHDADGAARGFAIITDDAMHALALDPADLGATGSREAIEPFGHVVVHHLDLEVRWQAERGLRRIDIDDSRAVVDERVVVEASAAEVWGALTTPDRRAAWEGAIVMVDKPGTPRGVGSTARCVTGRLATLEEIVDWMPYEHVGYRLAVPGIGPVEASYDLDAVEAGTEVRLRWAVADREGVDETRLDAAVTDRRGALQRLATIERGTA